MTESSVTGISLDILNEALKENYKFRDRLEGTYE